MLLHFFFKVGRAHMVIGRAVQKQSAREPRGKQATLQNFATYWITLDLVCIFEEQFIWSKLANSLDGILHFVLPVSCLFAPKRC